METKRSIRFQPKPVHDIRHQLLESCILHACDAFGTLEILGRGVAALLPLACVVDQEFGDLARARPSLRL